MKKNKYLRQIRRISVGIKDGLYRIGQWALGVHRANAAGFIRITEKYGIGITVFLCSVTAFVVVAALLIIFVPVSRARKQAKAVPASAVSTVVDELHDGNDDPKEGSNDEGLCGTEEAEPVLTEDDLSEEDHVSDSSETQTQAAQAENDDSDTIRFEKYDSGEEVKAIQSRLMELGYMAADEPTEFFSNATRAAVRLFQRQAGLQEDGIVGEETYSLLMSKKAKSYVMTEGAEGNDIRSFQTMLCDLGYLPEGKITGYYGTDTVEAVKAFQKRNSLKADGKAGEKTMDAINSENARPSEELEQKIEDEKKRAEEEAKKKSAESRIDIMIKTAEGQLGKPYVLGDRGPKSFDCSGLAYYCMRKAGVYIQRLNAAGYSSISYWEKITTLDGLKRGDLIFFKSNNGKRVSHVGICIGGGMMIDASSSEGRVVKRTCKGGWARRNFVCGRRPIS